MRVSALHEVFIEKARRPMTFGRLPVKPVENDLAIIPVEKWVKVDSPQRLRKKFKFRSQKMRNEFVKEIFDFELEKNHNATITVDEDFVVIELRTKNIDQITEIDKEFAKFVDELFKDIVYTSEDEL
jgi:pterin-4a-carbinolamine dehydratase